MYLQQLQDTFKYASASYNKEIFSVYNTVTRDSVCITIHGNKTSANKHYILHNHTLLHTRKHTHKK